MSEPLEMNNLEMSEKAKPLLAAVIKHIRENVDPISEEFHRLGEGRADRWSYAPGQLELLETAKQKARDSGSVELLSAQRRNRRRAAEPRLRLHRGGTGQEAPSPRKR